MTLHRYTQYGFDGPYWDNDDDEDTIERPDNVTWDDRPDEDDEGYWEGQDA